MPKRLAFILPSIISITLTTYGYFEALNIKAEKLEIRTNKLKEKIRIAQISDLHIGLIVREERLKKIIDIISKESPDMVVSTGDLVDGQIDGLEGLNGLLREINPPLGKYAVVGNHEYYAGFEKALAFTQRAGFRVLRDELIDINGKILVAGVDDPQAKAYGLWRGLPERAILSGLPKDKFVLLLKHRPRVESEGLFDLQLSGHVHNGQIFPFRLITKLAYPYLSGLYEFGSSLLYVSRGSGTWGPPVRVLSPPEVTIIDLIPLEPSGN
jgi:predicted MPP superfamily phosphohydrolase